MKSLFLMLSLILVITAATKGQDIIYKTDGTELKTKVIEIEEASVKYRIFDQLDGPLRSIAKAEVFLIIYENGTREKFENSSRDGKGTESVVPPSNTIRNQFDHAEKSNTRKKEYLDLKIEQAKTLGNIGEVMFYGGALGMVAGLLGGNTDVIVVSGIIFNVGWPLWIAGDTMKNKFEKRRYELSLFIAPKCNESMCLSKNAYPFIGLRVKL